MTKKHSTKRSLIASLLILCLCITSLIGTTFAWFTDEVTSANNKIVSGSLKVDLELLDKASGEWSSVKETRTPIFNYDNWEPGYIDAKVLKVENEGSLSLKWKAKLVSEKQLGILADVIDVYVYAWGVLDDASGVGYPADRTLSGYTRVGTLREFINSVESTTYGNLLAGESAYLGIALKMQESAGNEYQKQSLGSFDIQILAAQLTYENDSYGDDYDEDAMYPVVPAFPVNSTAELITRLANAYPGEEIYVSAGEYDVSSVIELPSDVTILGAQASNPAKNWIDNANAEKTVFKSTGSNIFEIRQNTNDTALATKNITIDGVMLDCANNSVKGIYTKKSAGKAMEGIKIVNCAVVNSSNDGIDVCNAYGPIIENNYVRNVKDTAIHLGSYNGYHYQTGAELTAYIRNNVVETVTATENGAIVIENGSGDVVVSGNVIKNVTPKANSEKTSGIHVYDVYEGGEILIDNNVIENVAQGISVYKYSFNVKIEKNQWTGPAVDNDIVVISNNKISGFSNFGIATFKLNVKANKENMTLVEINNNILSSTLTDNAISIDKSGEIWKVSASGNVFNASSSGVNGETNRPKPSNDYASLTDSLTSNGSAMMGGDIASTETLVIDGTVLDGDGNTYTNDGKRIMLINTTGGTIKNLDLVGSPINLGFVSFETERALGKASDTVLTSDLYLENVTITNSMYAVSINANGHNVYFKNCEFANKIEVINAGEAIFEDCHFYTDSASSSGLEHILLGGNLKFVNCHFEETINFYGETRYGGTLEFVNSTYGNNGVEDRPIEASVGFFTYWMEVTGVTLYNGAFGDGDPGRTNYTCIVDGTTVWTATNN